MDDLKVQTISLQDQLAMAFAQLKLPSLIDQKEALVRESQKDDFWSDSTSAQQTMKRLSALQARVEPWQKLSGSADDLLDMINLDDETMEPELRGQYDELQQKFDELREELRFNGPYDDHSA